MLKPVECNDLPGADDGGECYLEQDGLWEYVDCYSGDVHAQSERFIELEAQLTGMAPNVPDSRRAPRVIHRARVTVYYVPSRRIVRYPPGSIVPSEQERRQICARAHRARKRSRSKSERRCLRQWGSAIEQVRTAVQEATTAVLALWEDENDEGDNGYGHGARPHYDFDLLEPLAIQALQTLSAVITAARKQAITESALLSMQCILRFFDSLLSDTSVAASKPIVRANLEHAPPPGHQVATQPVCPHGPPRQPAAPPEWATAGWLAA